jgi:hypothetical protein
VAAKTEAQVQPLDRRLLEARGSKQATVANQANEPKNKEISAIFPF